MRQPLSVRFHDWLTDRARAALAVVLSLAALSLLVLPQLRLDMSFRPLFAGDGPAAADTRAFQAEFGQPSGAFIGVVTTAGPAPRMSRIADAVALVPRVSQVVTSADDPSLRSRSGEFEMLLARVDAPLEDLAVRTRAIRDFRTATASLTADGSPAHYVGVSVVEAEYATVVVRSVARSLLLTTASLIIVLAFLFRRPAAVAIALGGVTVTLPVATALLTLLGQQVTIVNSMVPTMILIIGVADAIHMLHCWIEERRTGSIMPNASRRMFQRMLLPCFLTSVTAALGFLSLRTAGMDAIRAFGTNTALGVMLVFVVNTILVPVLLRLVPERWILPHAGVGTTATSASIWLARHVMRRRVHVLTTFALLTIGAVALLPRLNVDQMFNEDVAASHPVRRAQALLEREFGGVLGPEIVIERADGATMLDATGLAAVSTLRQRLLAFPQVHHVASVFDLLPRDAVNDPVMAAAQLPAHRSISGPGASVRERVGSDGRRLALHVRIGDIGTRRSLALVDSITNVIRADLPPAFNARVVGDWYLAQLGMSRLLRDMLASFATSALVVLPILALGLRNRRLLVVAILPNVLPMLFALAFMAATGISVRIGTAMILAIALAIAVDDTIHLLSRLRTEPMLERDPEAAIAAALRATGPALLYTTVVLVLGFLSMAASDLLALRDMGIVAAATMAMAGICDLVLAPALFLQVAGPRRLRDPEPVPTSFDGGIALPAGPTFQRVTTTGAAQ